MKITAYEDNSGDPCYMAEGHVDETEFRSQLATMDDYGEDVESAEEYEITQCYVTVQTASSRFPGGSWRCALRDTIGARPVTLAALWAPKDRPSLESEPEPNPFKHVWTRSELNALFNHREVNLSV